MKKERLGALTRLKGEAKHCAVGMPLFWEFWRGALVAYLVSFQCQEVQRMMLQVTSIIESFHTVHSRLDLDQQKTNKFLTC